MTKIGSRMRAEREASGIRIGEFAELIGFTRPYLSAVETGKVMPSKSLIITYEEQLNLKRGTLLEVLFAERKLSGSAGKERVTRRSEATKDQEADLFVYFSAIAFRATQHVSSLSAGWLNSAEPDEFLHTNIELNRSAREYADSFSRELGGLPSAIQTRLREALVNVLPIAKEPDGSDIDNQFWSNQGGRIVVETQQPIEILTPDDEELQQRVIVTAEFGDNQFVPLNISKELFQTGGTRYEESTFQKIDQVVQNAFKLSLINGGSVLINRAYCINNQSIYKHFEQGAPERDAMIELLNTRAILPWLYREQRPDELPGFQTAKDGSGAWIAVLKQAPNAAAVRFSINDEDNKDQTAILASRFHENARNFESRTIAGYLEDFKVEVTPENEFLLASLLRLVGDVAGAAGWYRRLQGGAAATSREDLYRVFISTAPASSVYDGGALLSEDPRLLMADTPVEEVVDAVRAIQARFSPDAIRPMLPILKGLFDLAYSVGLADMTGAFVITAPGSVERRTLQEFRHAGGESRSKLVDRDQLLQMIEAEIFSDVMRTLSPIGLERLSHDDIVRLRSTDEWHIYQDALSELLVKAPFVFRKEAQAVCEAYANVLRRAPNGNIEWDSAIGISIAAAGQQLNVMWQNSRLIWNVRGAFDSRANRQKTPITAQLILGDEGGRSGWLSKIDFLSGAIQHPKTELPLIVEALEKNSRAQQGEVFWDRKSASTLNAPGDQQ